MLMKQDLTTCTLLTCKINMVYIVEGCASVYYGTLMLIIKETVTH